jgi:hypothetical protein
MALARSTANVDLNLDSIIEVTPVLWILGAKSWLFALANPALLRCSYNNIDQFWNSTEFKLLVGTASEEFVAQAAIGTFI